MPTLRSAASLSRWHENSEYTAKRAWQVHRAKLTTVNPAHKIFLPLVFGGLLLLSVLCTTLLVVAPKRALKQIPNLGQIYSWMNKAQALGFHKTGALLIPTRKIWLNYLTSHSLGLLLCLWVLIRPASLGCCQDGVRNGCKAPSTNAWHTESAQEVVKYYHQVLPFFNDFFSHRSFHPSQIQEGYSNKPVVSVVCNFSVQPTFLRNV